MPNVPIRRVLIVDDDEVIRMALGAIVRKAGYLVTYVSSAREAIAQIGDVPPNLIFTDVFVREADGFALLNWLRRTGSAIPLIAMSASNAMLTGQLGTATKLGAQATIAKPFRAADVLGAIERALGDRGPAWPSRRWA